MHRNKGGARRRKPVRWCRVSPMEEATRLATESVEKGWGGPFGAVIVKDGEIIGRGQNRVLLTGCPVFHAEITAIIDASSRLNPKGLLGTDYGAGTILEMIARPPGSPDLVPERARMLKGCEIYINGAPCPMCMSAIYWGSRHLLAELNFLLLDVDSADDGTSAQGFIKC